MVNPTRAPLQPISNNPPRPQKPVAKTNKENENPYHQMPLKNAANASAPANTNAILANTVAKVTSATSSKPSQLLVRQNKESFARQYAPLSATATQPPPPQYAAGILAGDPTYLALSSIPAPLPVENGNANDEAEIYNNRETSEEELYNNNTSANQNAETTVSLRQKEEKPYSNAGLKASKSTGPKTPEKQVNEVEDTSYVSSYTVWFDQFLISEAGSVVSMIDKAVQNYQIILSPQLRESKSWKKMIKEKVAAETLINKHLFPLDKDGARKATTMGFEFTICIINYYMMQHQKLLADKQETENLGRKFSQDKDLKFFTRWHDLTLNLDAFKQIEGVIIVFDALNLVKKSELSIHPLAVKRVKFYSTLLKKEESNALALAVIARRYHEQKLHANYNPRKQDFYGCCGDDATDLLENILEAREYKLPVKTESDSK